MPIYLDYQATTPVDPRVLNAMEPYWIKSFGNPHSGNHEFGWEAAEAVSQARSTVAKCLDVNSEDIIFTSGATESCNLAIKGIALANLEAKKKKIITLVTEHAAVYETANSLRRFGFEPVFLPVDNSGILDLEELRKSIDHNTLLVSVMAANNEIGVIQPILDIGEICREHDVIFHCDATQAIGKIRIRPEEMLIDAISFSGHKIYGPMGCGVLYFKNAQNSKISPLISGGSQEFGLRPGTAPVPLIVGLAKALEISCFELETNVEHLKRNTQNLLRTLSEQIDELIVFGSMKQRVCGNLCIGVKGLYAQELITSLSGKIAISSGSACRSLYDEPSRVLMALSNDPYVASTGVRISCGRFTTDSEVADASEIITSTVKSLV